MKEIKTNIHPVGNIIKNRLLYRCDLPNGDEIWLFPRIDANSPVGFSIDVTHIQTSKCKYESEKKRSKKLK